MKKWFAITLFAGLAFGREVQFGVKSFEVPGTLSLPAGKGPHPVVVLVHGSGPHDRDETIAKNKPFLDIAEGLNSRGIAVLRYDKRTKVHSYRGVTTVTDETVTDACEAVHFAQKQPEVDPKRVYVLGHSLGAYVIPRIVALCPDVAGVIAAAGPVRGLMDIVRDQVVSQNPLADPKPVLEQLRKGAPESYWKDLEGYDPAALAAKQTVPMLILQGGRDANVSVKEFELWRKGLAARTDVQYRTYPKLNHLFMAGEGPADLSEMMTLAGHVSPEVIADIAAFIRPETAASGSRVIRVGIVGTDTSHVPAFTRVMNDETAPGHIPGVRVVAAFKGGSPEIESSRTRVEGFAKDISEKYGVEIVPDIKTLLTKVDAVLLESVDGRSHLPQAREVIAAKKPLFIDKPIASTLADAREIARLAVAGKVPLFSASSLRFSEFVSQLKAGGAITGAIAWSPGPFEQHHALDLSWYGIHGVETLYALMGQGCEELVRIGSKDADEISCRWKDGRIGTVRVTRPYGPYGAVVFRKDGSFETTTRNPKIDYVPLVREIVRFFQTGESPVPLEETLEVMEFMDAAQKPGVVRQLSH